MVLISEVKVEGRGSKNPSRGGGKCDSEVKLIIRRQCVQKWVSLFRADGLHQQSIKTDAGHLILVAWILGVGVGIRRGKKVWNEMINIIIFSQRCGSRCHAFSPLFVQPVQVALWHGGRTIPVGSMSIGNDGAKQGPRNNSGTSGLGLN